MLGPKIFVWGVKNFGDKKCRLSKSLGSQHFWGQQCWGRKNVGGKTNLGRKFIGEKGGQYFGGVELFRLDPFETIKIGKLFNLTKSRTSLGTSVSNSDFDLGHDI